MKKVLVIVGPTAIGKSDFAIAAAQALDGEIISGDSIQVYRGLSIGSGKVTQDEQELAPHHLIDILNADENYSVADFQNKARQIIDELSAQEKLPIICGGTGLYIKACLYDYEFSEQSTVQEDSWKEVDNETLYAMLKEVDPKACESIHINNRKRIIRALTIAKSGINKSAMEQAQEHKMVYDVLLLGLTCEREHLYERINKRVDNMVKEGLFEEIETLLSREITFDHQAMQGIGYREWRNYFNQESSKEEVVEKIKTHSRQFAKRQYTWFNNQMNVNWIDIEKEDWKKQALETILAWRNNYE